MNTEETGATSEPTPESTSTPESTTVAETAASSDPQTSAASSESTEPAATVSVEVDVDYNAKLDEIILDQKQLVSDSSQIRDQVQMIQNVSIGFLVFFGIFVGLYIIWNFFRRL